MKIYRHIILSFFTVLTVHCLATETTDKINITPYHNQGFRGQGVRYAVIDKYLGGGGGVTWRLTV